VSANALEVVGSGSTVVAAAEPAPRGKEKSWPRFRFWFRMLWCYGKWRRWQPLVWSDGAYAVGLLTSGAVEQCLIRVLTRVADGLGLSQEAEALERRQSEIGRAVSGLEVDERRECLVSFSAGWVGSNVVSLAAGSGDPGLSWLRRTVAPREMGERWVVVDVKGGKFRLRLAAASEAVFRSQCRAERSAQRKLVRTMIVEGRGRGAESRRSAWWRQRLQRRSGLDLPWKSPDAASIQVTGLVNDLGSEARLQPKEL
jgi:hypothetical protein